MMLAKHANWLIHWEVSPLPDRETMTIFCPENSSRFISRSNTRSDDAVSNAVFAIDRDAVGCHNAVNAVNMKCYLIGEMLLKKYSL
jgi:hypothetical protein